MLNMGSVNVNATSRIGDLDVAYFNASIPITSEGNYSISKNITNMKYHEQNKDECSSDYYEFEKKVNDVARMAKKEFGLEVL